MLRQIRLLPTPGCNVSRRHFLLDQGVPMIMSEIHTGRRFNLHREASATIGASESSVKQRKQGGVTAQEGGSIHEDGDAKAKDGHARQVLPAGSVRTEGGEERGGEERQARSGVRAMEKDHTGDRGWGTCST